MFSFINKYKSANCIVCQTVSAPIFCDSKEHSKLPNEIVLLNFVNLLQS